MVKLNGPLFSLDASGTIGDAITFSKWKGRAYARERVIPSNPQSGPQVGMRAMLAFLSQEWAGLGAVAQATWTTRAAATAISGFNAFIGYNQNRWRSFKGPTQVDPAIDTAAGGDAPTTTPTGGIRQVQLSIAHGVASPTWGWLIFSSTVTGFTPAYSNLIAVIPTSADPDIYIHSGLTPDDYYYRIQGIGTDGLKGTMEAQVTGAAT